MSNTVDPVITLLLPVSKVNMVISGLAELPFKLSNDLIIEIKRQAEVDLQRQQAFMAATVEQEPSHVAL